MARLRNVYIGAVFAAAIAGPVDPVQAVIGRDPQQVRRGTRQGPYVQSRVPGAWMVRRCVCPLRTRLAEARTLSRS